MVRRVRRSDCSGEIVPRVLDLMSVMAGGKRPISYL